MVGKPGLDDAAATELHNRLVKQIVSQIVNEPIAAGGTMLDVMVLFSIFCTGNAYLSVDMHCRGVNSMLSIRHKSIDR